MIMLYVLYMCVYIQVLHSPNRPSLSTVSSPLTIATTPGAEVITPAGLDLLPPAVVIPEVAMEVRWDRRISGGSAAPAPP